VLLTSRKGLLRVPKSNTDAFSYAIQQDFYRDEICPSLGLENIVDQSLVRVPERLAAHLNSLLAALDDARARRADWHGTRVADTSEGMLVADMSPGPGQVLVQFKPKWLVQSPNAPEGSRRCRTCAREAERRHDRGRGAEEGGSSSSYFCPLDLLAASSRGEAAAAARIWAGCAGQLAERLGEKERERVRERFLSWLAATRLFSELASRQAEHDRVGALLVRQDEGAMDRRGLQIAMTLRDCSCYVLIPLDDAARPVQARLGDLDKKNGSKKLPHWRAMETALIDGGFYAAEEHPRQEMPCRLAR